MSHHGLFTDRGLPMEASVALQAKPENGLQSATAQRFPRELGKMIIFSRRSADVVLLRLSSDTLVGRDLRNAYLLSADLSGKSCVGADFRGARLRRADLAGADLREADFSESDLRGANLTGALLQNTCFVAASYDEQTRWPANFEANASGAILVDPESLPTPL